MVKGPTETTELHHVATNSHVAAAASIWRDDTAPG